MVPVLKLLDDSVMVAFCLGLNILGWYTRYRRYRQRNENKFNR